MDERAIDRWQHRSRIAIWLHFVAVVGVAAIAGVERAELFRIHSDGVFVGYEPPWRFALWSALLLATWGAFLFPVVTFLCAARISAALARARALITLILLGVAHIGLLLSAAQHAIL